MQHMLKTLKHQTQVKYSETQNKTWNTDQSNCCTISETQNKIWNTYQSNGWYLL